MSDRPQGAILRYLRANFPHHTVNQVNPGDSDFWLDRLAESPLDYTNRVGNRFANIAIEESGRGRNYIGRTLLLGLDGERGEYPVGALSAVRSTYDQPRLHVPQTEVEYLGSGMRGTNLGTDLLKSLRDLYPDHDLGLTAVDSAVPFYESLGFRRKQRRDPYNLWMPAEEPWHRANGGLV